ncbi:hypothetical protein FACS1894172_16960 [Spirochaetia bacterium]|nr:hypothetical protein FACS1894164_08950 [Spirochaetia bacterium]GHU35318.1 hypothetical protein FACS1894172_16960 [Spirochaetia bacterium]
MIESSMLYTCAFFGGLNDKQILLVESLMKKETYNPGEKAVTENQPNDSLRFILEGTFLLQKNGIKLVEFAPGDVFGEIEMLDAAPAAATITAQTPAKLLSFSHHAFHELYKQDIYAFALIVMNLARDACRRLRHMDDLAVKAPENYSI